MLATKAFLEYAAAPDPTAAVFDSTLPYGEIVPNPVSPVPKIFKTLSPGLFCIVNL